MANIHPDKAMPAVGMVARISWAAIFGGAAMAVVTMLLLMLLGMAIGFFTLDVATEENPLGGYGIGSYIWWVLSWVISLFLGGWIASRFAGLQRVNDGMLHGLITWALTTLIVLVLLTNIVGAVVGGAFGVARNVLGAAGQTAAQVLPGQDVAQSVLQEAQQTVEQVRQRGGEQAVSELTSAMREIFRQPQVTQADQQRLAGLLAKYTDMNEQEARNTVNRWVSSYEQARQSAAQAADALATALGHAALWSFISLLLGAVAAGLGGKVGRVSGPVSI